jgi:hypothetical protein
MERDLETRLEWVAIDHYNTDNPHVHLSFATITSDSLGDSPVALPAAETRQGTGGQ